MSKNLLDKGTTNQKAQDVPNGELAPNNTDCFTKMQQNNVNQAKKTDHLKKSSLPPNRLEPQRTTCNKRQPITNQSGQGSLTSSKPRQNKQKNHIIAT